MDDFGLDSFTEQPDGMLLFSFDFMDTDNLFSWLLSFGSQAELLGPAELRDIFFEMIQKMMKKYK
ncbi:WYL domain-containing protein [Frisingicoccus sp.]|uniref:WYL domain-containing protein n=1 Tax=Frisingicoccus sp. TaxID=1918627 RepID=UPI00399BAE11